MKRVYNARSRIARSLIGHPPQLLRCIVYPLSRSKVSLPGGSNTAKASSEQALVSSEQALVSREGGLMGVVLAPSAVTMECCVAFDAGAGAG